MMRTTVACLTTAILIGSAGCGSDNGLNLATVRGKVTYKGQPIKNGTVMFEPDESKGTTGPQAVGTITSDGSYILTSETAGDGAVVGMHKVGILGLDEKPAGSGEALPSPESDPTKFLQMKTAAGLKASKEAAKKDGERTVAGLDGKPYKVLLPENLSSTKTSGITAKVNRGSNVLNIDIDDNGIAQIK